MKQTQSASKPSLVKIHEKTIHEKVNFDDLIEEIKNDVLSKKQFIRNVANGFMTIRIPLIQQATPSFKDSLRIWLYNMGFKIMAEIETEKEWAIKMNLRPYQGGVN
jgi:hypothetical protein